MNALSDGLRNLFGPLRPYCQQIRRNRPGRGGVEEIRFVFAERASDVPNPMLDCKCGGQHPFLFRVEEGKRGRRGGWFGHTFERATPQCGPIVPLKLIAEFFEEEERFASRRMHIQVDDVEWEWECRDPNGTTVPAYTAAHAPKKQRPLNVARLLPARRKRSSTPKKDGLTPAEYACWMLLLSQWPDEFYRILKLGGTPDFVVIDRLTGKIVLWVECKTEKDSLAAITQQALVEAMHASGYPVLLYEMFRKQKLQEAA